jgi:hypothetical protein
MGDEQFTMQRETSRPRSGPSTNQRLSYATERAEVLFGCYRRGDANDPDRYVASIAAVLSLYDFELMRDVTDPRTGICTSEKYMSFMPNAGELKVYCDALVARRDRFEKLAELPRVDFSRARLPAPPEGPGARATVFVPASNSRYAALLEWSKTADPLLFKFEQRPGIWVAYGIWDQGIALRPAPRHERPTSLQLSDIARRTMAGIDAERSHDLPSDHAEESAG